MNTLQRSIRGIARTNMGRPRTTAPMEDTSPSSSPSTPAPSRTAKRTFGESIIIRSKDQGSSCAQRRFTLREGEAAVSYGALTLHDVEAILPLLSKLRGSSRCWSSAWFCHCRSLSAASVGRVRASGEFGHTAKGRAMACFNEGKDVGKDLDLACNISSS
ncbi:hypothetical protein BDR22DRAFT_977971 [Usnea florida]